MVKKDIPYSDGNVIPDNLKILAIILAVSFIITIVLLKISYDQKDLQNKQQNDAQNEIIQGSEVALDNEGSKFVDENIEKLDKDAANQLVINYEKTLKKRKDEYEKQFAQLGYDEKFYSYFTGSDNSLESVLDRIYNEDDASIIKKLYEDGLAIEIADTRAHPIINYPLIMEEYGEYLYDSVKKYIYIKVLAVENPVILGNKLQLSLNDLGKRLVDIEEILYDENISGTANEVTNVKSVTKDKIDKEILSELFELYKMYYYVYTKGESSAAKYQIFDSKTGKIKPELISSYKNTISIGEDTEVAKGLKLYMEWLESHDNLVNKNELEAYFNTEKTIENIRQKMVF